jgi:hypothetical protein
MMQVGHHDPQIFIKNGSSGRLSLVMIRLVSDNSGNSKAGTGRSSAVFVTISVGLPKRIYSMATRPIKITSGIKKPNLSDFLRLVFLLLC